MQYQRLAATLEVITGLGMLLSFALVLAIPAGFSLLLDLPWLIRYPPRLSPPGFGLNPHLVAGAPYAPSVVVLLACAVLVVCFRWLTTRRSR